MSNWQNFTTQLISILQSVQQAGNPAFADVKNIPTIIFNGFPAVTVVPTDNGSEYATNAQNLRTYAFDIDIYYGIAQDTNGGYQAAFNIMLPLVDAVLDALDNSNDLNGLADILRPAPSIWGTVEGSSGVLLRARITLQAVVLTSQNNG